MIEAVRCRLGGKTPKTELDFNFIPVTKRHFRESREWRRKRGRIIAKIRALGRFQLAFLLSRMPVIFFNFARQDTLYESS
uniref:Uncharacterized protein n=2 Tax=Meloidogyne TaxID=189290 RepID=A0A914P0I1_MELIC